jgi:hypothetical protein
MHNAAKMFSFDPNPTRTKKPGPLLLVYFMDTADTVQYRTVRYPGTHQALKNGPKDKILARYF